MLESLGHEECGLVAALAQPNQPKRFKGIHVHPTKITTRYPKTDNVSPGYFTTGAYTIPLNPKSVLPRILYIL